MKKLILASQSPRRSQLLTQQGYVFEILPSQIPENLNPSLSPSQNALAIAKQKALSIARKHKGVILAADTFVVVGKKILGKPKDIHEAREMIQLLSGQMHHVMTGFIVYDTQTKNEFSKAVTTQVKFKKLSQQFIDHYVKTQNHLDKAGAYAIQESGDNLIESIEGSLTNVVGLPIEEVSQALKNFGIVPNK